MPSYLQIENISKSYGHKVLFEGIGFNINEGDKIALIAPNGTGKTSLLRILAGKDSSDSGGKITFLKDIRISFLEQEFDYDPQNGILSQILQSSRALLSTMDEDHRYAFELRARQFISSFSLGDPSRRMKELSGGEIKRVALCTMLSTEADFYIMDEPTNHLDIEAIEYLEGYLSHARTTLLMVTHDRYFLDRVCNTVMELDHGSVYIYKGDYENYLEKRTERIENYNAQTDKVRNILRRELEWMRSTPCARSGKAKYRKDAFYALKERSEDVHRIQQVSLSELPTGARLGSKVINCKDVSFHYGGKCYLDHFTYNFARYERVGIVGGNGEGKTTFVNLLVGEMHPEDPGILTGEIDRGESLSIGYYRQRGIDFDEDQTVLETVSDTHLLSRFLFPHEMLSNKVSTLSGGEKRRLYLLTVLSKNPNLLILDEPTNDLDIMTLNILEEYLREFKGSLIIISHDRHFMDRLVDHLLIFTGDGKIKDFVGKFSEYREYIREQKAARKAPLQEQKKDTRTPREAKRRLSFKEKREMEQLEKDIEALTEEKEALQEGLSTGAFSGEELLRASQRYSALSDELDGKELRWLELSELA